MAPFIPNDDSQAVTFMVQFANTIASGYSVYMLTHADSVTISAAVAAFQAAYALSSDPPTRNAISVMNKDNTRTSAELIVRQYAALIKPNAGISDSDKLAIGISPVNPSRTPINVPNSSPLMNIIGATPGSHTLRYADTSTPDSKKKPFGAMNLQLFVAVGTAAATDPTAARFYGAFTTNPVGVEFNSADNGKQATYFARWADRKGAVGPWSLPITMAIAA